MNYYNNLEVGAYLDRKCKLYEFTRDQTRDYESSDSGLQNAF